LPAEVWAEAAILYQTAYEKLTGKAFEAGAYPVAPRLLSNLEKAGLKI
jgi:hypothetical protein